MDWLPGVCCVREAPERAIGSDGPAGLSLGEDWRAGKWGLTWQMASDGEKWAVRLAAADRLQLRNEKPTTPEKQPTA